MQVQVAVALGFTDHDDCDDTTWIPVDPAATASCSEKSYSTVASLPD